MFGIFRSGFSTIIWMRFGSIRMISIVMIVITVFAYSGKHFKDLLSLAGFANRILEK